MAAYGQTAGLAKASMRTLQQSLRAQWTLDKNGRIQTDWLSQGTHESLIQLEAADLVRASGDLIHTMMQGIYDPSARGEFTKKIQVH